MSKRMTARRGSFRATSTTPEARPAERQTATGTGPQSAGNRPRPKTGSGRSGPLTAMISKDGWWKRGIMTVLPAAHILKRFISMKG